MRLRYLVFLNVMKPSLSCVILNPLVGGPEVSVFQANPGVTHVVFPGVNRLSWGPPAAQLLGRGKDLALRG